MSKSDHLLFSAGGINLATDSAAVHCIHESLPTQNEEGTQDWFLGLAVADERLLPVTDLGAYLHGENSAGRVLEVAKQLGIAGLKIDEVHGVSRQPPELVQAGSTESDNVVDQSESPLLNRAITEAGQHYQLLDLAKLMQSGRFLNVKHLPV